MKSTGLMKRNAPGVLETFVLKDKTGTRAGLWLVFVAVLVAPAIANTLGGIKAQRTESFALRSGVEPCVVIRNYGERIVCVGVDTVSKLVTRKFWLLTETDSIAFQVAPLILRKPPLTNQTRLRSPRVPVGIANPKSSKP